MGFAQWSPHFTLQLSTWELGISNMAYNTSMESHMEWLMACLRLEILNLPHGHHRGMWRVLSSWFVVNRSLLYHYFRTWYLDLSMAVFTHAQIVQESLKIGQALRSLVKSFGCRKLGNSMSIIKLPTKKLQVSSTSVRFTPNCTRRHTRPLLVSMNKFEHRGTLQQMKEKKWRSERK